MKSNKIIDNKEIKIILLDLLKKFDIICRQNNLKYSLCGGTLLGAVRHKGFIPWDDDVDVFMKRDEYLKFCKVVRRYQKQFHIKLLNYSNSGYYATFAKIIDTRTCAIENTRNEKIGVWIDLHVIDYVNTKNINDFAEMIKWIKEIRAFGSSSYIDRFNLTPKGRRFSLKRKINRLIKKPILKRKIEGFLYDNSGNNEVSFSFPDKVSFWCDIPNLDFDSLIELEFEGVKLFCIRKYDSYLSAKYGNYMEIPKEKDRRLHDVGICRWKK